MANDDESEGGARPSNVGWLTGNIAVSCLSHQTATRDEKDVKNLRMPKP